MRLCAVPLLLYIVVDFSDASMPGAFFFDSDNLFVDGIVQVFSEEALAALTPRMELRAIEALASRIALDTSRAAPPPTVVSHRIRGHPRLLHSDASSPPVSEDH